jgi:hypothetical protein
MMSVVMYWRRDREEFEDTPLSEKNVSDAFKLWQRAWMELPEFQ